MIQDLDDTLFRLFVTRLTTLGPTPPTADQIRFQPPDDVWRNHVTNDLGTLNALNVYLADVRENRKLRTKERERLYEDGGTLVLERPSPVRLDCHYLISAWSSSTEDPADANRASSGKTGEEHTILSEVAALLCETQPLVPATIYGGAVPVGFATEFASATLPTKVLPVDGFPKYGEFWSSMEEPHPWKPAVYLIVTIPIAAELRPAGPPVTTLSAAYRQNGAADGKLIDIGGRVLSNSKAVPGALVRLLDAAGANVLQSVEADADGRFRFDRLVAGTYVFQAGALGVGSDSRTINVPSPTGKYDLSLV